jgi:NADP-dependent 3-hydroxy acid dehydrogenase YdfG
VISQPNSKLSPVVLITGGSSGIGAACVRRFLLSGWHVSVIALPDVNLEWLKSLDILITAGDITSEQIRSTAVESTLETYGRIDVLINNAGIGLYGLATSVSSTLFSRLLDVNVVAPLAMAQLVIPSMLAQNSGTIVTIGSVAGNVALPWAAAYSASKSALHAIHSSLRLELRGKPVHLIKVCPGIVDTDFRGHVLAGEPPEQVRKIQRIISPNALADAIFRAIIRRNKTVYLPAIGSLFSLLGLLTPALMDRYLVRLLPSDYSRQPSWNDAIGTKRERG